MRTRKREIARAGIYGTPEEPKNVTAKDIKEIAETFPEIGSAPVQFGHDANAAAPRMGNVVSVYCDPDGNKLYADIAENDVLADAVDSGFYPDVSIGAAQRAKDGKMYLRHLAYLGQESPAVKNMIAEIKEPLGIAAADAEGLVIFPPPRQFQVNLSDPPQTNKEDNLVTKEEAQKLREENEALRKEINKRDIALSDSVTQKTKADIKRLKAAMTDARIVAPLQEKFLQIAAAFEPGKTIELSDSTSGSTEKMSAIDALIKVASAYTPPVQTGVLNLSDLENEDHAKRDYSRLINKG